MTILDLLKEGREFYAGLDLDKDLDVEILLAFTLGVEKEYLLSHGEENVEAGDRDVFLKYLEQRANGEPIAYITHTKEFYGLDFYVDERVLVPRPETELIVDEVLDFLTGEEMTEELVKRAGVAEGVSEVRLPVATMLDVGTGSLNITTAVLKNFDNVCADAVDVSEDALEVARMNREYHDLETWVEVYYSDLLSNVDGREFDVIVSNLPYIGAGKFDTATDDVKKSEPHSALYGKNASAGSSGLDLYKKLIQQIVEKNVDFNLLVCEFGFGQVDGVKQLLNKFFDQGFQWEIKDDLAGIPRIFVVKKIK